MQVSTRSQVLLAAILVFISVVVSGWFRTAPMIIADEIGYLGIAKLFATGAGPNMAFSTHYNFGYSILITPLFWFSDNIRHIYHGAMVINAVCIALFVPCLIRLAEELEIKVDWWVVVAAALVAVWPSKVYQSYFALGEALFGLIFLLSIISFSSLLRKNGARQASIFALTIVALYAIHTRSILMFPIAAVAFLGILIADRDKRNTIAVLCGFATMIVGYIVVRDVQGYAASSLWEGVSSDGSRMVQMVKSAFTYVGLCRFLVIASGQLWYLLASTLGLAGLGALIIIGAISKNRNRREGAVLLFALASTAGIYVASVGNFLDAFRLDHIFYGRYNDAVAGLFIWMAIVWLLTHETKGRLYLAVIVSMGGLAVFSGYYAARVFPLPLSAMFNIPGIAFPYALAKSQVDLALPALVFGVTLLTLVVSGFLLFMGSASRLRTVGVLSLIAIFVVSSNVWLVSGLRSAANSTEFALKANADVISAIDGPYYWDMSALDSGYIFLNQIMLKMPIVDVINISSTPPPPSSYIISGPSTVLDGSVCVGKFVDGMRILTNKAGAIPSC